MECVDKSENIDGNVDTNDLPNDDQVLSLISDAMFVDSILSVNPLGPPTRGNFAGEANFEISIDGSQTRRKKFLFSAKLNKIYVDIGVDFPLKFNWDASKYQYMYVRATVIYSDADQAQKKVEACYQHSFYSNTANSVTGRNVLRSGRELGVPDVYYFGRDDDPDSWYSVLVAGNPSLEHPYQFVCKNSCTSGINRRNIEIIFTLEDALGVVFGRQSVGVRVCSCPRRDMNKDEVAMEGTGVKRPAPSQPNTTKKIKIDVQHQQQQQQHDTVVTLPSLSVVGIPTVVSGLRVMLSMQEQALAIKTDNYQPVDDLIKCITDMKKCIDDLEDKLKDKPS
ncbi:p53 [Danaus plexippus plexippus]|uniref:P53 n=1 Tax=Danaus plexippus plexippus TaxID=278856 RepID=A0A212FJ15_DANPL|nr:p53 [Danaus plexippus plexippus]